MPSVYSNFPASFVRVKNVKRQPHVLCIDLHMQVVHDLKMVTFKIPVWRIAFPCLWQNNTVLSAEEMIHRERETLPYHLDFFVEQKCPSAFIIKSCLMTYNNETLIYPSMYFLPPLN